MNRCSTLCEMSTNNESEEVPPLTVYYEPLKGRHQSFKSWQVVLVSPDEQPQQEEEKEEDAEVTAASTKAATARGVPKKWARDDSAEKLVGKKVLQELSVSPVEFLRQHLLGKEERKGEDGFFRKQILQKLQSYQQQDEQDGKRLHHVPRREHTLYTKTSTDREEYALFVKKMFMENDCRCFYCLQQVSLIYEYTYDYSQWSLDRLNNFLPHLLDNVVLSCLRCNLQRGCQSVSSMQRRKSQASPPMVISLESTGEGNPSPSSAIAPPDDCMTL